MSRQALKDELDNDPLARDYAAMSDQAAADSLTKVKDRTRIRESMTGDELFQQTDATQFGVLSEHKRLAWLAFCGKDTINPGATANVAFVEWIFGDPSATRTNLIAARSESISRAEELVLGKTRTGEIERARALP